MSRQVSQVNSCDKYIAKTHKILVANHVAIRDILLKGDEKCEQRNQSQLMESPEYLLTEPLSLPVPGPRVRTRRSWLLDSRPTRQARAEFDTLGAKYVYSVPIATALDESKQCIVLYRLTDYRGLYVCMYLAGAYANHLHT